MRGGTVASFGLATVCGVLTAFATLQPALQQQKDEREGIFVEQHQSTEDREKVLSRAIASDFKEAREEVEKSYEGVKKGQFAWGIRQALFGHEPPRSQARPAATTKEDEAKTWDHKS